MKLGPGLSAQVGRSGDAKYHVDEDLEHVAGGIVVSVQHHGFC
jgi:hypothetical protein